MIISIDCETQGLDATKFIMGCVTNENLKSKIYYNKHELWNDIIEKGKRLADQKKVLNVYAHNMQYDFYAIADLKDKNLKWFSENPFICAYTQKKVIEGKEKTIEIIKFLDTYSIFKMSLEALGQLIGLHKQEMPIEFKEGQQIPKETLQKYEPYVTRDTEIVMKAVQYMRKKLQNEGVNIKRLYTIHQIAIQYFLNKMKNINADYFFYDENKNETHYSHQKKKIHEAYRGGRTECFQTGLIQHVTYLDCNSLYPYSAMNIKFPDLRTEKYTINPLATMTQTELLQEIGISRCLIHNKTNKIGLLPIRTPDFSYYPKDKTYLIGTWTHTELQEAIKEGYDILDIEWTITWQEAPINPYKTIIPEMYKKRKESQTEFDNYFYKQIMNSSFGKLAQTRTGQEMIIDSVEKAQEYIKKGYEMIKGIDYDYMYRKKAIKIHEKPYYAPIIPTLINAYARTYMYTQFKKVPDDTLVYTDTDSICYTGENLDKFTIGNAIGQFKIEHRDEEMLIWGRKTYRIAQELKAAGIHKKDLKPEDFEQGFIKTRQMITIKQTAEIDKVGTFKPEQRNLKEQQQRFKETQQILKEKQLFVDDNLTNIQYFIPKIKEHVLLQEQP